MDRLYLHICLGPMSEEITQKESVYFLRNTSGMVELPNSIEEANNM